MTIKMSKYSNFVKILQIKLIYEFVNNINWPVQLTSSTFKLGLLSNLLLVCICVSEFFVIVTIFGPIIVSGWLYSIDKHTQIQTCVP